MSITTIELERDAVEKLAAAKLTPEETYSEVVRRAQFPRKPRLARELLDDFKQRAGHSPLSEKALDKLAEAAAAKFQIPTSKLQTNPTSNSESECGRKTFALSLAELWILEFEVYLESGIWDLEILAFHAGYSFSSSVSGQ